MDKVVKGIKDKSNDIILEDEVSGKDEKIKKDENALNEISYLKSQLEGLEILLKQNAALEKEVERLCDELDEVTNGVQKKGYLYKWREREIYFAPKWGLRYFVLQGNKISYYGDDHELRPRRTIDLSNCFVRQEGTKKGGLYHVFAIYLSGSHESDSSIDSSLLLRLSTESEAEASLWVDMLEQACALGDDSFRNNSVNNYFQRKYSLPNGKSDNELSSPENKGLTKQQSNKDIQEGDWGHTPIDLESDEDSQIASIDSELKSNSTLMKRVRSSSRMLKKSMSRQTMARRVLFNRAPKEFSASGTRLSTIQQSNSKIHLKKHSLRPSQKSFPAYRPMHVKSVSSPLSNERRPGEYNFRGFFNLGVIILILSHFDLIINNLAKYGFKFTLFPIWDSTASQIRELGLNDKNLNDFFYFKLFVGIITLVFPIFIQFAIEKYAYYGKISEKWILLINYFFGTLNICLPCYLVWVGDMHPGLNMLYLFQAVILWMKLISYAHANKDLRVANFKIKQIDMQNSQSSPNNKKSGYSSGDECYDNNAKPYSDKLHKLFSEIKDLEPPYLLYPQNLTLSNLVYFCIAPTLCYQLNYPRSNQISWSHVFSLLFRMVFVSAVIIFSVEQYIKPTLETSIGPMSELDFLMIFERLLKLSIPNTYVWLLGFYLYFHLWLNFLAEITRFGDRQFYKDWWNARTIDSYWRTWNMPVHHWITRHLYHPLLRHGFSKTMATVVVFAFSALMHEVVISIPFKYIALHAFFGMLVQAPLIAITKYIDRRYDNAFIGNALFWCLFCVVGQPMGIIMYHHDLWKVSMLK